MSAHVARLEKELGTTLVDRSQGGLTDAGQAREAIPHLEDALRIDKDNKRARTLLDQARFKAKS